MRGSNPQDEVEGIGPEDEVVGSSPLVEATSVTFAEAIPTENLQGPC